MRDVYQTAPCSVASPSSDDAARRFAVYRNNSTVSLIFALADSFPVVQALVGVPFFYGLAKAFVAQNLPQSPVLLEYGANFPDFVATFPPAAKLVFLADVARVEQAWREAYHAADAEPLPIGALGHYGERRSLADVRFSLHPSVRLVASEYSAASIWHAHNNDQDGTCHDLLRTIEQRPQACMIVRPAAAVTVHLLAPQAYELIRTLGDARCLGEAAEAAGIEAAEELAGMLNFAFAAGSFAAISA